MPARYPLTLGSAYPPDEQLEFLEWEPKAWERYCSGNTVYARVRGKKGIGVIMTSGECAIETQNPELIKGTPLDKDTVLGFAFADGEHCPYENEPRSLFEYGHRRRKLWYAISTFYFFRLAWTLNKYEQNH